VEELRRGLFTLTDKIVAGRAEPIRKLAETFEHLNQRKRKVLDSYSNTSGIPMLIGQLLDDCIKYGTIPFTILARYAFIANSLLKSLVAREVFSPEDQEAFLHSIETVATDLVNDLNAVKTGKISRDELLKRYGHLRPGTYDITSYRYDERPDFYFPLGGLQELATVGESRVTKSFHLSSKKNSEIEKLILETGFTFTADQLIGFIRNAMIFREYGKFEFTKSVSDILVILEKFGQKFGFSRDDLSFINIEQLRNWGINYYPCDYKEIVKAEIDFGRNWFKRGHGVKLPYLIRTTEDADIMELKASRPNFVTLKKTTGQIQVLNNSDDGSLLRGKIALIEGADPGYDWIFAHGIIGLITKYGGAASHMTIRAAEFGIPAAIGCGDYLFKHIRSATSVTLDCNAQAIHVL